MTPSNVLVALEGSPHEIPTAPTDFGITWLSCETHERIVWRDVGGSVSHQIAMLSKTRAVTSVRRTQSYWGKALTERRRSIEWEYSIKESIYNFVTWVRELPNRAIAEIMAEFDELFKTVRSLVH